MKCCVKGCNSSSSRSKEAKYSFFSFPKKEGIRQKWMENIGRENIKPLKFLRVCSEHFEESCINKTLNLTRLKDDALPTLFPFQVGLNKKKPSYLDQSGVPFLRNTDNSLNTSAQQVLLEPQPGTSTQKDFGYDDQFAEHKSSFELDHMVIHIVNPTTTSSGKSQPTNMEIYVPAYEEKVYENNEKDCKLKRKLEVQRKKIKMLSQKCRRLNHKVHTFQTLIKELKEKTLSCRCTNLQTDKPEKNLKNT